MTDKRIIECLLLRYVHDADTGEFLNVGLLVAVCQNCKPQFFFQRDSGRVKRLWPDADTGKLSSALERIKLACPDLGYGHAVTVANKLTATVDELSTFESRLHWNRCGFSGELNVRNLIVTGPSDPGPEVRRFFAKLVKQ